MARPRLRNPETIIRPKSPVFRLLVDEDGLTDELYGFVTDPSPKRNDRPIVDDLHEIAPGMVPVLEAMLIDGVDKRSDVAEYVRAVLFGVGVISQD